VRNLDRDGEWALRYADDLPILEEGKSLSKDFSYDSERIHQCSINYPKIVLKRPKLVNIKIGM